MNEQQRGLMIKALHGDREAFDELQKTNPVPNLDVRKGDYLTSLLTFEALNDETIPDDKKIKILSDFLRTKPKNKNHEHHQNHQLEECKD